MTMVSNEILSKVSKTDSHFSWERLVFNFSEYRAYPSSIPSHKLHHLPTIPIENRNRRRSLQIPKGISAHILSSRIALLRLRVGNHTGPRAVVHEIPASAIVARDALYAAVVGAGGSRHRLSVNPGIIGFGDGRVCESQVAVFADGGVVEFADEVVGGAGGVEGCCGLLHGYG